jgi:hypothetical protein
MAPTLRLSGPSTHTHHTTTLAHGTEGEATLPKMVVARYRLESYVTDTMQYSFSLPTKSDKVPAGPEWIHEIKYDGYRMMLSATRTACDLSAGAGTIGLSASR